MARLIPSTRSRVTRPAGLAAAVAATVEILKSRTFLSASDLDPTFGVGGKLVHGSHLIPTALALQSDGKILFSGWGLGDSGSVARLNPDGTPDAAFGNVYGVPGVASSNTGSCIAFSTGVAVGPTGRVAVSGHPSYAEYEPKYGPDTGTLAVYTPAGRLDPAFAGDGSIDTAAYGPSFRDVAFQADDKVLAVGRKLVRFNPDGTPDTTFDGDGVLPKVVEAQDAPSIAKGTDATPAGRLPPSATGSR